MKTSILVLGLFIMYLSLTSGYKIDRVYPDAGPTKGLTKVNIFSYEFKGLNYTDFPTPKCQFGKHEPTGASWVHCYGWNKAEKGEKNETCLTCMSPAHDIEETVQLKISLNGDFKDTLTADFIYYIQPTVLYSVPFIGSKNGNTFVQVFGKNFRDFGENLRCAFGTVYVPARFVSSNMITCRSPPSDVIDAPMPLKVTQNLQQATESYIAYYFYTPPEISELIPNRGPNTGGTFVYIKGKMLHPFKNSNPDFYNTTFVSFGKDIIIRVKLINNTHASIVTPPTSGEGPRAVEITFNNQEWTNNGILFFFYSPPYVFELIPNFGTIDGGTNVTVVGVNFADSGELKCRFADKVVPAHYIDPTHAWCITPKGDQAGYVDFGLAVYGEDYSGDFIRYLYMNKPIIDKVYPLCGPTTGMTQITITGKNFVRIGANRAYCIFGKDRYEPITIINETLMYCDSPSVLDANGNNINNTEKYSFEVTLNLADIINPNLTFHYYTQPSIYSIYPFSGPLKGNTSVSIKGSDFSKYCKLTVRYGTTQVDATLSPDGEVKSKSPEVSCPGEVVVQVSLNGQQYTTNQYSSDETVFSYYSDPIVSYAKPSTFPMSGGSTISIYGYDFLLSRNSTKNKDGSKRMPYKCRFKDSKTGTILGETQADLVNDNQVKIVCKTVAVPNPMTNVIVEVSPNDQSWYPTENRISFYKSPIVRSIDPKFGMIKQHGGKLTVDGKNFDCDDPSCPLLKCSFSTDEYRILTSGMRIDSNTIYCDIPSMSRPEVTIFQVTLNGFDFTNDNITYTFYDAFVLSLDPPIVPVEGGTHVSVIGYGFAKTDQLKVKFLRRGEELRCGTKPCIIPAKYISSEELQFVAPPEVDVTDTAGHRIGFQPFEVEVSVYGDSFTENGIKLQYYEQPDVGKLTEDGSNYIFHQGSIDTIHFPVKIKTPEGTDPEEFVRKMKIRCRYQVGDETVVTRGTLVDYPFPTSYNAKNQKAIDCPLPPLKNTGNGVLSITLNGENYAAGIPITVKPELKIVSISPQCGQKAGDTRVTISTRGFDNADLNKLFFTWSTVCTAPIGRELLLEDNKISTITPPVPYVETSPGGTSLVYFAIEKKEILENGTIRGQIQNHYESLNEFLYYRMPIVKYVYPHSGSFRGGTPVLIEGAFFFNDLKHACTPKCKFGNKIVEAEYLSTVQLRCLAPPDVEKNAVSLTVTMNGFENVASEERHVFTYFPDSVIKDISPKSGPSTGGTLLVLTGSNFIDLSAYPNEFGCVFRSLSLNTIKKTNAKFLNSTTILCTTPGGWGAGTLASVDITYNGMEFTNSNQTFRFYQIDSITPRSGPASGDPNNYITITGSGFQNAEGVACQISGNITKAVVVNWTHILCPIPGSFMGPNYFGHADLLYTLNGKEWNVVLDGFTFYPQITFVKSTPSFISKNGGSIIVEGKDFKSGFFGANISCKIGNTHGAGTFLDETHIRCNFGEIQLENKKINHIQVSLNDVSFTPISDKALITVYDVTSLKPRYGISQGGTPIRVTGYGFPQGLTPLCRFGIPGRSAVTYGTVISETEITCNSPSADLPAVGDYPYEVPFAVSFDKPEFDTWTRNGLTFYYYIQPAPIDIEPKSVLVDQTVLVTITSSNQLPFGASIIGSPITTDDRYLTSNIECRFGRFGSTKGTLSSWNTITCPSPSTNMALSDISEETVNVEVAMNGHDFASGTLTFKFIGSKSSSHGFAWLIAVILGGLVLVGLLYLISKLFQAPSEQQPARYPPGNYPGANPGNYPGSNPSNLPGGNLGGGSTIKRIVP